MFRIGIINHLLEQAKEARFELAQYSGRRFALCVLGIRTLAVVDKEGFLIQILDDVEVSIVVKDGAIFKLLQGQAIGVGDVMLTGAHDLGMALLPILGSLRYYVHDDVARVFGPVLANRMMQQIQMLKQGLLQGKKHLQGSITDFAYERNAPFIHQQIFASWAEDVAKLQDDVARLEARVNKFVSD